MIANTTTLITKLEAHLASLGDGKDARSDREKEEYWTTTTSIQRTISALMNLPQDVKRNDARLADLESRRTTVLQKQTEIETSLREAPDAGSIRDAWERGKEATRQDNLRRQLQLLRDGRLYLAPGDIAEPLTHLDQRIADFRTRRDQAQVGLDHHLRQADAWLGETVTT